MANFPFPRWRIGTHYERTSTHSLDLVFSWGRKLKSITRRDSCFEFTELDEVLSVLLMSMQCTVHSVRSFEGESREKEILCYYFCTTFSGFSHIAHLSGNEERKFTELEFRLPPHFMAPAAIAAAERWK